MKHVFIASLGLFPQVITEALWAFIHPRELIDPAHRDREPIVPDEVVLVSTTAFRRPPYESTDERDEQIRARIRLLFEQNQKKAPTVDIHRLKDGEKSGAEAWLKDIRTQRENAVYSNHVIRVVKGYSEQADTVIHMLLAGGRKTMSSYDQSAMMFFGRTQDTLSHVLVEPMMLESHADFWWPDQPFEARTADGTVIDTSSKSAKIDLVDVPFARLGVRLPAGVPAEALDAQLITEFVEFELKRAPIIVDASDMSLTIGNEKILFTSAGYFCMVALLAVARQQNWKGAGPEGEGTGANSSGWVFLDDFQFGLGEDCRPRQTPALKFLRLLSARIHESRPWSAKGKTNDLNWIDAIDNVSAGDGSIDSLRTRTNDFLRKRISSPYIAEAAKMGAYGKKPGYAGGGVTRGGRVVGLELAPERIILKGFTGDELKVGEN